MSCFGFIGTGNMGSACARVVKKTHAENKILLSNRTKEKAQILAQEFNASCVENTDVAKCAKFIFLGVKPQSFASLFDEIGPLLQKRADNFVLVSMAAGVEIKQVQKLAGRNIPVIRIMPNTPVAVGKGIVLFACSKEVDGESKAEFLNSMKAAGSLYELPEEQIDIACAVSGCGPAYVAMFIEALADGAVACGLNRKLAYKLASETLIGTSQLQIDDGCWPAALKDSVCSPAGTTIEGVRVLEECGFRGAVIDAVIASFEKNKTFK